MLFNILVFSLHYVIRLLYFFKDLSEVSVSRSCTLIIHVGHTGDRESHIYFLTSFGETLDINSVQRCKREWHLNS